MENSEEKQENEEKEESVDNSTSEQDDSESETSSIDLLPSLVTMVLENPNAIEKINSLDEAVAGRFFDYLEQKRSYEYS